MWRSRASTSRISRTAGGISGFTFTPREKILPSISQSFRPLSIETSAGRCRASSPSINSQVRSVSITCVSASMVGISTPEKLKLFLQIYNFRFLGLRESLFCFESRPTQVLRGQNLVQTAHRRRGVETCEALRAAHLLELVHGAHQRQRHVEGGGDLERLADVFVAVAERAAVAVVALEKVLHPAGRLARAGGLEQREEKLRIEPLRREPARDLGCDDAVRGGEHDDGDLHRLGHPGLRDADDLLAEVFEKLEAGVEGLFFAADHDR